MIREAAAISMGSNVPGLMPYAMLMLYYIMLVWEVLYQRLRKQQSRLQQLPRRRSQRYRQAKVILEMRRSTLPARHPRTRWVCHVVPSRGVGVAGSCNVMLGGTYGGGGGRE